MDSREDYEKKLVAAEEAVRVVKSGDRVAFSLDVLGGPVALAKALAARRGELKNVEIEMTTLLLGYDDWFQPGWEESFRVVVQSSIGDVVRPMVAERRADYNPRLFSLWGKAHDEGRPGMRGTDVFMTMVSSPDQAGYCGLGCDVWSKNWQIKKCEQYSRA